MSKGGILIPDLAMVDMVDSSEVEEEEREKRPLLMPYARELIYPREHLDAKGSRVSGLNWLLPDLLYESLSLVLSERVALSRKFELLVPSPVLYEGYKVPLSLRGESYLKEHNVHYLEFISGNQDYLRWRVRVYLQVGLRVFDYYKEELDEYDFTVLTRESISAEVLQVESLFEDGFNNLGFRELLPYLEYSVGRLLSISNYFHSFRDRFRGGVLSLFDYILEQDELYKEAHMDFPFI